MEKVKAALKALGLSGHFTCQFISNDRILVRRFGEKFGIFDTVRNTFVD